MGRKERNRLTNDNDKDRDVKENNKVEDEIEEIFQYEEETVLQTEYDQMIYDIIWKTRKAMINYCDEECIPLCDYMTMNIFEKFIEHLTEPS
jgi:hypothetical protein